MRTEEFVGRAREHVAADRLHVDHRMRREVHGIHVAQGPAPGELARRGAERADVVDTAHAVGGRAGRHKARLRVYDRGQGLRAGVQQALASGDDGQPAHLNVAGLGELHPRPDIGSMADGIQNHVAAWDQSAGRTQGAGHMVGEDGHARPNDDLVGCTVQEVCHCPADVDNGKPSSSAGLIRAANVCSAAPELLDHGLDDARVHLRAAGSVREDLRQA
mmetsp:Transcript_46357/g.148903  ORF Transcript_46357/g.148903 Transcript_46357/m.148903 type:complete len:218 (+) Transcript_46357:646-1299(+)